MHKAVAALAVVFLAAHLASLPITLEDLDSVNFAFGVRHFDVAQHQPHPPGYPAFIALGKLATGVCAALGVTAPEARGLAVWSALAGALLIPILYWLFAALEGGVRPGSGRGLIPDRHRPLIAALIALTSPLAWFTALRPLSDMIGLTAAMGAVAALAIATTPDAAGRFAGRTGLLTAGALLAGLALGFRVQTGALTLPFLAWTLVSRWPALPARSRIAAAAAAATGVLLWAVPLVVASGGLSAYLTALGSQAGEDFSGVVMVWTNRTVRVAVFAVLHTLVFPWDSPVLAGFVLSIAAAGAGVLLVRRAFRPLMLLVVIFGPYAIFHLLLQETVTIRYALPLVPPVAYLAAVTFAEARALAAATALAAVVTCSLWLAAPAAVAFGRTPSPVFGLLADLRGQSLDGEPVTAMHRRIWSESRRARQWVGGIPGRLLPSPRDYEWLEMTRQWREGFRGTTWFLADPRRTDLALIDSRSGSMRPYRWPFESAVYVGGTRPDEIDWRAYQAPGWFLERGWALTPEIAGVTERDGWGPHIRPSDGWIRRRPGAAAMVLGGRHLGGAGDTDAKIAVSIDGRPVAELTTGPGFFVRFVDLPAGALAGSDSSYAHLTVAAAGVNGARAPRVGLEQFDVQDAGEVVFGFGEGWHEPEYNPRTARSWRWMGNRAVVEVRNAGRPVVLRVRGEAPRHYFDSAPEFTISAGGQPLARFTPFDDFSFEVAVPAAALAGDGRIVLESSLAFVAGEREGTADQRRLGLKMYSLEVRAR